MPVGKKLRFDESIARKLKHVEVRTYDGRRRGRIDFNDWFGFRTNVDYVMTDKGENGTLIDPNKPADEPPTPPSNGDYRYQQTEPVTKDSLEAQRRRVQEEQKKLKDMEEKSKQKKDSISGNSRKESMDDIKNEEGIAGSRVLSLVQMFN